MSNVLDFQVNGLNPSKVGGTGTTVKYFQRILGTNGPNSGPNTNISSTNAAGALFLPAAGVFEGQSFNIIANGNFGSDTGDPSGTVTVQLFAVTGSLTSPTYTAIASTGAVTPTFGAAYPWSLDAVLSADSVSGILQGTYTAVVRNVIVNSATPKALDATLTGLNFLTGNASLGQGAVMGFVVGVTFGTSDATNKASLYEFTIES